MASLFVALKVFANTIQERTEYIVWMEDRYSDIRKKAVLRRKNRVRVLFFIQKHEAKAAAATLLNV